MNHFYFHSSYFIVCQVTLTVADNSVKTGGWIPLKPIVNFSNYLIGLITFIYNNYSKTTNKSYAAAAGEYVKIDEFNWIFCFQINTPEFNNVLLTLNLICKINLFKIIHWCFILTLLRKFWSVRKNICQKCCTRLAILTTFSSIHTIGSAIALISNQRGRLYAATSTPETIGEMFFSRVINNILYHKIE